jgi:hypothetical protein
MRYGIFERKSLISGGAESLKADRERYIVRANSAVASGECHGWFRRSHSVGMRPGDTIVVPLYTERVRALRLWQAVRTIIYNLAVVVVAVREPGRTRKGHRQDSDDRYLCSSSS